MAAINEEELQDYLDQQMSLMAQEDTEGSDLLAQQPVTQEKQQNQAREGFVSWQSYSDNPDFLALSPEEKRQFFGEWKKYAVDYLNATGNLVTKKDAEFTQNYFQQLEKLEGLGQGEDTPNYAEQLLSEAQSGFRSLQSGVAGYGALIGAADPDEAAKAIVSRNVEEQNRYVSPELQEYGKKQLGFFGAAKELISNPFDLILPFFAQSMGSNLPALGSALVAGGVGTAVGTPATGAAAALYTGAALGGATDALVTVNQLLNEEVQKRGLDTTKPEDVASVLKDPEFKERALKESTARGLAIGATGLASLGLGQIVAKPASEIAKAGFRGVMKEGGKQLAIQTVAEPVGESAAQVGAQIATGQPVELRGREIAEETFVGLPTAAVEAGAITYKNLVQNSAPSTANEVLREAVNTFRQEEIGRITAEPQTDQSQANFYDSLTIGEKVKILGLAPNAILTEGQSVYANLTPEQKTMVGQAFEGAKQATAPAVTAAETEAKAAEEAQKALEEVPAPVVEAPAPVAEAPAPTVEAPAPVAEAPAVTPVVEAPAPAPAPTPITEAPPIAEAPKAELGTVAPATAAVVEAEAPVPTAPTEKETELPIQTTITNIDRIVEQGGGKVQVEENGIEVPFEDFALMIDDEAKTATVGMVRRNIKAAKGSGTRAYIALGQELAKRGITLESSSSQYGKGQQLWANLAKAGYAVRVGNNYRFSAPAPAPAPAPTLAPAPAPSPIKQFGQIEYTPSSLEDSAQKLKNSFSADERSKGSVLLEATEKEKNDIQKQIEKAEKRILQDLAKRLPEKFKVYDFRSDLLTLVFSEDGIEKHIEKYGLPISISDVKDKMPITLDWKPKVETLSVFEGNEESSPETIAIANKLTSKPNQTVRVYTSQPQEVIDRIKDGDIPAGIFVSPKREVAEGYFGEGRSVYSFKIPLNRVNQVSGIDWQVLPVTQPTKPEKATVTKVLPPTKKQISSLEKLGYLPADIQALNRTQAKDIIANQTPKVPVEKAPQVKAEVPAPAEPGPAQAQRAVGEVGKPVAPPAGEPATQETVEQRLAKADQKLTAVLEKLGGTLDPNVKLDNASVTAYFGGVPDQKTQQKVQSLLRLVTLGLSNAKERLAKAKGAGRNLGQTFTNIDKIVFTKEQQGGGGIYSDPRNPFEAGTLYINPDQLTRALLTDLTMDPANFFASMLEEEIIHANHGKAMVGAFVKTFPPEQNPEIYTSPQATLDAFTKFYDAQNKEIENSLTLDQIKRVVGRYAQSLGIDMAGKTKEQIVQEFNAGRPGRLAEEYLRALIQERQLGAITEDQVKAYATRPILRALGALRNWFRDLVGKGVGRQSQKTFIDKQHDAILDLLLNSSQIELRAAQEEANTAIPGKILASSIDPFAQEIQRQNKQSKSELQSEIERELSEGGLWRRTIIGRLKKAYPAVDPAEVESLVYASVPEALGSFDEGRGTKFSTHLTNIANRKILREKMKTVRRQAREFVSFQAPGFYNVPTELRNAETVENEVEAEREDLTLDQLAEKVVTKAPTLEAEIKAQEKVAPVVEEKVLAAAYDPETGKTNIAEEGQELEELTLADGEQISSLDAEVAEKRTAYIEAQLGEAGRLLAGAARALGLTKLETEILAYAADPEASALNRKQITDKYGLTNDQFTNMRDDVLNRMREQLGKAGVTRTADVLASSIDPTQSQALARAKTTLPKDVAAEVNAVVKDPFTDAELEQQARDFVKANSPNGDIMHAKRILDGRKNIPFGDKIATLAVIGKVLRDRAIKLGSDIEKNGTSPEKTELLRYTNANLREVFSAAQALASQAGQDLRSVRTANGIFLPYTWESLYTGPISDQQEQLLKSKQEVIQLKAEIQRLMAVLAGDSANGIYIQPPETSDGAPRIGVGDKPVGTPVPEGENFYQLLSLFGDLSPIEGENFTDYLARLGVPYDDVIAALEGVKAASVSATGVSKIIPSNLRSLPAAEAIRQLVGIDKNFFGKLVSLRIKSGGGATEAEISAAFNRKKANVKDRPAELQTVFDFFNSTESTKPTSEAPIEKDTLPPLVRLAKYAADTVTDRVMRSLGVDKKKTPADSFTKLERQVRALVNAQFKQETNPSQASPEDTRSVEQRLLDAVQRISLAEDVFNQVQAGLREQIAADNKARELKAETRLSDKERADLEQRASKVFNPNAVSSLDSLLRKVIDFKAEARKHMSQRGSSVESLTEIIKQKFPNFTEKQATSLGTFLSARYAKLAEDAKTRQLANIVRRIGEKATAMPKGKMQQLFELINLGAFDDEKFYNAIAERYDIPEWDPAVAEEIRKRADKIQRLPQGSDQQSTETFMLQAYIADELNKQKKGWEKLSRTLDVWASLWKAGVLSGPPTQIVNLGATHANVLMELFAEANAYKKMAKAQGLDGRFQDFLGSILSAWVDSVGRVGAEQAGDAFATGITRFRNEKLTELTPLETFKFDPSKKWSLNNYLAAWKIVGRAMAAGDTYNAVVANEAKARMAARYAMLKDGLSPEEATKLSNEIFNRNSASSLALQEQVNKEEAEGQFGSLAGLDPDSSAYRSEKRKIAAGKRRRFEQLRDQMIVREGKLGEVGLQNIRDFTLTATFNNQPQGLIGYIGGQIIGSIAGKVPALVPFAAFPRTIANIINAGLNYTPYGFARAYGFSLGNMFGAVRDGGYAFKAPEPGSVDFHKLQTQALYGSIVTFTLIALALKDMDKDWDDAFFAVTGRGPADAERREQLRASGWTENTVKFGPLRFKHTDFPGLNTIFGSMALLSDMYRYGNLKEADFATLASSVGMSIGNSVFDKQLLSGAKTLFEAFSDRGNASDKAKRVIQSYTGGILNPGFAKWLTKTFAIGPDGMVGVTDYKTLNATTAGFLIGLTPMAVVVGKPQLNRLGEEIREYPYAATSKRFGVLPETKEHPVFSPLVKAGLFVPGASINLKINDFEKGKPVQRKMDREEYYNYTKYNGEYLRKRLTPQRAQMIAKLGERNQDAAQKILEDMARASKDYAKARIEAEIRLKRRRK